MLLRHYLAQGLTKAVIAERLGINRRTINRWISKGDLDRDVDATVPRYGPRPAVPTKLDPFKPIIETRLKALPELSAVRLLEEIRAAGYTGGYTQLKEYVRKIRPRETEAVVRFETPPGHQAQVDFADFRLPWGKRYALLVVLGYSRLLWLRFFARKDMATLLAGLEQAFAFFGGVPRELLFDQMRSVITKDDRLDGRRLVHNAEFLRFSAHWSFTPRACRPYRAKTKGKVERPVSYVRGNFFYGREFLNDHDLNAQRGPRHLRQCRSQPRIALSDRYGLSFPSRRSRGSPDRPGPRDAKCPAVGNFDISSPVSARNFMEKIRDAITLAAVKPRSSTLIV